MRRARMILLKRRAFDLRFMFYDRKRRVFFSCNAVKPKGNKKNPAVVHIAFRPDIPDKY